MAHTDILERWLKDPFQPEIKLGWEVLPAPSGVPHLVDPDPDSVTDNFPVSLCGTYLLVKGGTIEPGDICVVCLEISKERQAEFDAERGYVP
jgi:hypothetical protein